MLFIYGSVCSRRDQDGDVNNPGNNLYVAGLSSRTTEQDLEDHFAKEGKVGASSLLLHWFQRVKSPSFPHSKKQPSACGWTCPQREWNLPG